MSYLPVSISGSTPISFLLRKSQLQRLTTKHYLRARLENRRILFGPTSGLEFDDGEVTVNYGDSHSNGIIASSDDLYGATLELLVNIGPVPVPAGSDPDNFFAFLPAGIDPNRLFVLDGLQFDLPGNRSYWVKGDQFTRIVDEKKSIHYRFQFPSSREQFEKLAREF